MALHVDERGSASDQLAVVIHSAGLIGSETVDLFGLAPPGFRVLAPDRTNYGQSPRSTAGGAGRSQGKVPEAALLEADADEIASLLARGGHLFGYSYGGVVALHIACRFPERVRSLALLEPPALQLVPDDPDVAATRDRIESGLRPVFDDAGAYWRAFMTSTFGDSPPIPPDAVPTDRQEASRREQVPWDVELDLDAIAGTGIPTLVMCGDWDPGFTAVARHLADRLSGRLVEFSDADHFFMANGPDIGAEVESFWKANNPPST
jgi:pimeloyl-ACP methyl ester carboxylesterase